MSGYVATIQVLVEADSQQEAIDGICETLRNVSDDTFIVDWAYFKLGAQQLTPTLIFIDLEDYKEGDFLHGYARYAL